MRLASLLPSLSFLAAACVMTGPAPREIEASLAAPVSETRATFSDSAPFAPTFEPAGGPAARAWRQEGMQEKKKKEPWINIFSFVSTRELDEVTFENDDTDVETDASNVETTRTGVGVMFGKRNVRGYVQGFIEHMEGQFDIAVPDLDADGIGFGGGVLGEPRIATFSDSTYLILPYRLDGGLKYKHPGFPLWIDVRAVVGDVEGVTGTLGFTL
jgi:hypothetical protein